MAIAMRTHVCVHCGEQKHIPELNDATDVSPKIRLDELVQLVGHGPAMFRVMKMSGMEIVLDKI